MGSNRVTAGYSIDEDERYPVYSIFKTEEERGVYPAANLSARNVKKIEKAFAEYEKYQKLLSRVFDKKGGYDFSTL